MSIEPMDLDATAQADLVRRGAISPRELVDLALERIERDNPALNAVIHRLDDKARAAAAAGVPDARGVDAPFRGVPMLVKDGVCHTAGDPFHCGMRVLRDLGWTEPDDADLARRFRRAGFVIVGKTNLPELASTVTTEPLAYGPTRNPWDLERSTGGSSGGSAAAVAARMVAVAHGNDMGGSIRFPASMCGLVGLKPTRARTSLAPSFGEYWAMTTHEFVLVRSVRDAAGILDAVHGASPGDPYTAPTPERPFVASLAAALVDGSPPLRVGVADRRVHPDVSAAIERTAAELERLGHRVESVDVSWLDDERVGFGLAVLFPAFIARDVERWSRRIGREIQLDELEPNNAAMVELGRRVSALEWQAGVEAVQEWSRDVAARFVHRDRDVFDDAFDDARVADERYDLLLTATAPNPPQLLGANDPLAGDAVAFTIPFNLTGQPAISLPVHWTDSGLPIGVQLVAATGREELLFAVGAQLEAALEWTDRVPPGL